MDAQAKKILDTVWCETSQDGRLDPEDVGLQRALGWGIDYEQNKFPERKVWNQLLREIQGALRDHMREGILNWQPDLDYPQYAFVKHNGALYVCDETVAAGGREPGLNLRWRRY